MYQLEVVNELTLKATNMDGQGKLFTKAGAMVGYQGQMHFEKRLLGPQGNPVQAALGHLGRRLTGENLPLMECKSRGQSISYYANEAQHVVVLNLQQGMTICVESENILAFTDNVRYSVKLMGAGVISQKGLFTSTLTGAGPGAQVAILISGNPIVLDTPCCVDPDAHVAHIGPDPGFKLDLSWKNIIGQASGESYMLEYKQPGGKVIIQPNERTSGIDIGIDGHGTNRSPNMQQNNLFAEGGNPLSGMMNNGNQGGPTGSTGSVGNILGGIFGNR